MHQRTFFIQSATVVLMALGFVALSRTAEPIPLSKSLSHANFTAYIGQSFYVYGGEKGLRKVISKVISLEMIEVSERRQESKTEQFTVRFRGPDNPVLNKNVYTFEHPATTDKFQLFLEPEGKAAKGQYYRTVFNLLR